MFFTVSLCVVEISLFFLLFSRVGSKEREIPIFKVNQSDFRKQSY